MFITPENAGLPLGVSIPSVSGDLNVGRVFPPIQHFTNFPCYFPGLAENAISRVLDQFPQGSLDVVPAVALHVGLNTDIIRSTDDALSPRTHGALSIGGEAEIHLTADVLADVILPAFMGWHNSSKDGKGFEGNWDMGQRLVGFLNGLATGSIWEQMQPLVQDNQPAQTYYCLYAAAKNLPPQLGTQFVETVVAGFKGHPAVESHLSSFVQKDGGHELAHIMVDGMFGISYPRELLEAVPTVENIPASLIEPRLPKLNRLIGRLNRIDNVAAPGFVGTCLELNHAYVALANQALSSSEQQQEHMRMALLRGVSESVAMATIIEPDQVNCGAKEAMYWGYVHSTSRQLHGGLFHWWDLAREFQAGGFACLPAMAEREVRQLQAQVGSAVTLI